jgi:hypothetical protein
LDKLPIIHSSTEVKNYLKAFAKAQLDFKTVIRSKKGHYGEYADINDINNATRTALNKNGISIMQGIAQGKVMTILGHESGEHFIFELEYKQNDMKATQMGAVWTLMRRYALQSALGVAGSDDIEVVNEESNTIVFTPDFNDGEQIELSKDAKNMWDALRAGIQLNTWATQAEFNEWYTENQMTLHRIKKSNKKDYDFLIAEFKTHKSTLEEK